MPEFLYRFVMPLVVGCIVALALRGVALGSVAAFRRWWIG